MQALMEDLVILQEMRSCSEKNVFSFFWTDRTIQMFLPNARKDRIQRLIVLSSTFYEAPLLQFLSDNLDLDDATILDCGANIGNHSVYFGAFMTKGEVHAFEALPSTYAILKRNAELNSSTNITAHGCPLGIDGNKVRIGKFLPHNLGATSFVAPDSKATGGSPSFETRSLDSFGFKNVGLIKIDVEGMQRPVLEGAADLIADCKPAICIEINERDDDVSDLLEHYGYTQRKIINKANFLYRRQ